MSQPRVSSIEKNPSAMVLESELNDIVSPTTTFPRSDNVDVGYPFGELEFCNANNFDDSLFLD